MHPDDKPKSPTDIDKIISAELPNKDDDPVLHKIVLESMIHGSCDGLNKKYSCIIDDKCSKNFPKATCNNTFFDEDKITIYTRRKNTNIAVKNGVTIDNTWVVPYDPSLLKEYNAHINM